MTFEIYNPQDKLVWYTVNTGRIYGWRESPSVSETVKKALGGIGTTSTRNGFSLNLLFSDIVVEPGKTYDASASMVLGRVGISISESGDSLKFADGSRMVATPIGYRNY